VTRTINATTQTALEQDELRLAHLVRIGFTTELFLTDNFFPITYESNEYIAAGHLLSISSTQETNQLRVGTVNITLSAVDQAYVSIFLNQTYVNRRVRIFLAILTSAGAISGDPIKTFDGEIVGYDLQNGKNSAVVNMKLASHWSDFERKAGRFTNNNSQQYLFPTDTSMRFAAQSVKDIQWGKA
jgi:hypothetical protein